MGTGNLLDAASRMAGIGPAISLPIFHGGALNANLAGRRADADLAISDYNQSVLDAVRQADALDGLRLLEQERASSARRAPPSTRPTTWPSSATPAWAIPVGADRADGRADPGPPRHRPAHPRLPAGRRPGPTHWAADTRPPRPPPQTPSPRPPAPPLTDRPGFRRHERPLPTPPANACCCSRPAPSCSSPSPTASGGPCSAPISKTPTTPTCTAISCRSRRRCPAPSSPSRPTTPKP